MTKQTSTPQKLRKAIHCTDNHFGKKGNSLEHNENCLNFILWMCDIVKADPTIDHVVLTGDWHEHRSSVHGITLKYSVDAMKALDDLGIPVFYMPGNHDLVQRQTRNYYTTYFAHCFKNFRVISEPTVIDEIHGKSLMCPFLFEDEYKDLVKYTNIPVWWGHFEFKDFVITGHNVRMPTGPDHNDFVGPKRIFSGHYHKRQQNGAVYYTGNVFPMDYSDIGDTNRGVTIYDYVTNEVSHKAWPYAPVFIKAKLTSILDGAVEMPARASVKCVIDMPITYEESVALKQQLISEYNLKELILEESEELNEALTNTDAELSDQLMGTSELVMDMLHQIDTPKIDRAKLIKLYTQLQTSRNE